MFQFEFECFPRFGAKFPYIQVFWHAGSESEVHVETGSSILGVSAHAQ